MYAVVKIGGSQYKISPGEILEVDKLDYPAEKLFEIDQTLLAVDGDKVQIGQPYLADFKVTARVLKQFQGKKIRVARFKAKVRYRKVKGFRAQLTQIKIEKIGVQEAKEEIKAKSSKISVPKKTIKKAKKEAKA